MSASSLQLLLVVASVALGLAALPLCAYLGILATLAWTPRRFAAQQPPRTRFAFVVPAHNEEAGIAATVRSLLDVQWPRALFEVFVVADNCSDNTADAARAAGATVLVRHNRDLRGKGYALEHGFGHVLGDARGFDAIVVVDADTVVTSGLLHAYAARIDAGALAMQAEYAVRNVDASWRTELMALALAMFHTLRSHARERLALSAGLRGNGMCFTRGCLERFPHNAYGLVEDVEYGIALGRGGVRVFAVDEERVLGEMVSGGKASESQRRRWEEGRTKLRREVLPPLLREAVGKRDRVLFDLALDLLVPPLSSVALLAAAGVVVEAARLVAGGAAWPVVGVHVATTVGLALYVLRGMQLSGLGMRAVVVLAKAPAYVVWKLVLKLKGKGGNAWVRTAREPGEKS